MKDVDALIDSIRRCWVLRDYAACESLCSRVRSDLERLAANLRGADLACTCLSPSSGSNFCRFCGKPK